MSLPTIKTLTRLLGLSIVISFLSLYLTASTERPNSVLIRVDDMGWSDVGSYGGELPTPPIDA